MDSLTMLAEVRKTLNTIEQGCMTVQTMLDHRQEDLARTSLETMSMMASGAGALVAEAVREWPATAHLGEGHAPTAEEREVGQLCVESTGGNPCG